jgi:hypothetical protein
MSLQRLAGVFPARSPIAERIPQGSSAIIAVAEDRVVERLQRGIEGYRNISRHALSADASAQLIAEVEAEPDTAADTAKR